MNPQDNKDEQVQPSTDQPNLEVSEQPASAPEVSGAAPAAEPPKPEDETTAPAVEDAPPAAVEPPAPEQSESAPEVAVSEQPDATPVEAPEVNVVSDPSAAQSAAGQKGNKSLVVLGLALVLLGVAALAAFVLI